MRERSQDEERAAGRVSNTDFTTFTVRRPSDISFKSEPGRRQWFSLKTNHCLYVFPRCKPSAMRPSRIR